MLSKNDFCRIIRKLIREMEFIHKYNEMCIEYNKDICCYDLNSIQLSLDILKLVFNDTAELIDYWFWECEYGANYVPYIKINNEDFEFITPENLYDVLIKMQE